METKKQSKEMPKSFWLIIMSIPVIMFGIFGGLLGLLGKNPNFLAGFLGGLGVGVVVMAGTYVWMSGWEWVKKEAQKGRLLPFMITGLIVAVAISSYFALSMGSPSCIESDTDNRGSTCLEYADDGFEATTEQKWSKFWSTLPVTLIIASLVAYIVRNEMNKSGKQPKI